MQYEPGAGGKPPPRAFCPVTSVTSTATALTVSKVMPYVVGAALFGWMIAYGRHARREGERLAAAAEAAAQAATPAGPAGR